MGDTTTETPDAPPNAEHDKLRAAVRTDGRPMTVISQEIGLAYGTFSVWMGGKDAGDNERIAQAVAKWLATRGARAAAREVLPRAPSYIATPSAKAFTTTLEYAQYAPDLVIISGGAGVGKTTAADEYRRGHPNVWLFTARPSFSTMQPMLEQLLVTLDTTERAASRRSGAIIRRMIGSQGLLIVDEAQHLQVGALDELRSIQDASGVGLALVGNETVYSRLEGQGRTPQYAQLFSRIGMRTQRATPLVADVDALIDAWGITNPGQRRTLRAIGRKPGALRGMTKVLRVAHMLSAGDAAEPGVLTEDHIKAAWSRLSDTAVEGAAA